MCSKAGVAVGGGLNLCASKCFFACVCVCVCFISSVSPSSPGRRAVKEDVKSIK